MERILQIIDANQNRAREGLRIIEEVCRFMIQDGSLTTKVREIRHNVSDLVDRFYGFNILKERDIDKDIGKGFVGTPYKENGYLGFIKANFSRVEEALRTIEEFSRLKSKDVAPYFKRLRFEIYGLEKEVYGALNRSLHKRRMKGVYAIIDLGLIGNGYMEFAKGVIEGGAVILQLRGKEKKIQDLLIISQELCNLAKTKDVIFIVNDRVDVALGVDADGVHLGQEDMPIRTARKLMGQDKIIGASTHNLDEVKRAIDEGVDYISFGPIYKTQTKPELYPIGTNLLPKIRKLTTIPIFAIGGINIDNLKGLKGSGIDGVVCASYLVRAESTIEATQRLLERVRSELE